MRRPNQLRDKSTHWSIVDSIANDPATRTLRKRQLRELVKQRIAQEYRVDVAVVGLNPALKSYVSRLLALINPVDEMASAALIKARKMGLHFLKCYKIAIGAMSLQQATQKTNSTSHSKLFISENQLRDAFCDLIERGIKSGFFIEEICEIFFKIQANVTGGLDLGEYYYHSHPPQIDQ